jgi:hypothetical protein
MCLWESFACQNPSSLYLITCSSKDSAVGLPALWYFLDDLSFLALACTSLAACMRRRRSSVNKPVVKATVQEVPSARLRRVRSAAFEGTGSVFGISKKAWPSHSHHETSQRYRERGVELWSFKVERLKIGDHLLGHRRISWRVDLTGCALKIWVRLAIGETAGDFGKSW